MCLFAQRAGNLDQKELDYCNARCTLTGLELSTSDRITQDGC